MKTISTIDNRQSAIYNRQSSRLLIIIAIVLIGAGCDLFGGTKAKYSKTVEALEKLSGQLQEREKTMGDYLQMRKAPETNCRAEMKMDSLMEKVASVRAELDNLKPEDMPTREETLQTGIDPNTQKPILETELVVDWGKISGNEQKLWANLNSAEYAISTAVDMLEVGCQCIDGKDKTSIHCSMVGFQFKDGSFSLDVDISSTYLDISRKILEEM